jgi:hypothetical protein
MHREQHDVLFIGQTQFVASLRGPCFLYHVLPGVVRRVCC